MPFEHRASDDASPSAVACATSPFESVPASLRAALEGRGFERLTAVQRAVLEAEAEGRDLQISSQTGSGKTVALGFVLAPPLEEPADGPGPRALIIVPTRELATQVSEELAWLMAGIDGLRVGSVTGGTPLYKDRKLLARRPGLLVGTPGRLLDHVRSGALDLGGVRELVLDEADQMLDLGFREELEGILDATPPERRTHLVSATFPAGIQSLAARYQVSPLAIEGTRLGRAHDDIEHEGHVVLLRDRYAALVNLLLQADGERTLVFVERRSDALEVAERLEADGFAALPLSGELAQSQRERTLSAFRAGRAAVLVATDVAARGLDVPDVMTVIHTTPPPDAEVYTHRSGRTGRAGKRGRSVLLSPPSRKRRVAALLSRAGVELRWLPVPGAAQVREVLAARSRKALVEDLSEALEQGPPEAHLAHAEELLAGHEAAPLVAALLARLEPTGRVQPQDVSAPEEPRQPERPRFERPAGPGAGARPWREDRPERSARPARNGRPDRSLGAGSVRFFMNYGLNQGANPSRILAAVCRRGEVTGSDVGSIAIHPNATTFDVRREVAEHFERLAARRDPRDRQTLIRRDRGPQTGARGR
jgi:ATP-dependent RNA helicase DeaD